jgi:hypothetical protein
MTHLSRICAMSIGEDHDAAEGEADPAWRKETAMNESAAVQDWLGK